MGGVIHRAGEPIGLVQKCSDCGEVLTDYTNASSEGDWEPTWWEGLVTVYSGNPRQTVAFADDGAIPCTRMAV